MVKRITIELTEKDLKKFLCSEFRIDNNSATLTITKFDGDKRDPAYTKIEITGIDEFNDLLNSTPTKN